MSRNPSRFAAGSAVYACRCCGRNTRSTGRGDNENVRLCADCYDLGGEENGLSDSGSLYGSPEEILRMIANVSSLGGNASCWNELKSHAEGVIAKRA